MRIKRFKKTHRAISFFEKNYGFHKPYQILVDGTLAQAALLTKVNLRDQLPKYLDGEIKLLTTPCIVIETESIGPELSGALQILKQYPIHKCSHLANPIGAEACIHSMIKPGPGTSTTGAGTTANPNRYIIATQDQSLRIQLRKIPGVPLLYLHGNAPTLEKPSHTTLFAANQLNQRKTEVADYQKETLVQLKREAFGGESSSAGSARPRKRKQKGGPNPLSCKKSKKKKSNKSRSSSTSSTRKPEESIPTQNTQKFKKKRRIKVKIPEHVKAELSKMK